VDRKAVKRYIEETQNREIAFRSRANARKGRIEPKDTLRTEKRVVAKEL
jgi:hypothetical protein